MPGICHTYIFVCPNSASISHHHPREYCIHVCKYVYIYHTTICVNTIIYVYIYITVCVNIICMSIHVYRCIYTYRHTYMYTCILICVYIYEHQNQIGISKYGIGCVSPNTASRSIHTIICVNASPRCVRKVKDCIITICATPLTLCTCSTCLFFFCLPMSACIIAYMYTRTPSHDDPQHTQNKCYNVYAHNS